MTQKIEPRRFSPAYFTDRVSARGRYVEKIYVNRDRWRCTGSSRLTFFTSKRDKLSCCLINDRYHVLSNE